MSHQRSSKRTWIVRLAATAAAVVIGGSILVSSARADEVVLKNGDTLHGTIGEITAGVMKFNSPNLGSMSIKLSDIKAYKTDEPANVRLKGGTSVVAPITEGNATQITTANGQAISTDQVSTVNFPKAAWTGAVVTSGVLNRGNTNNETVGIAADATLRRQTDDINDRFQLGADYNFGTTGKGGDSATTTDNWDGRFAYDRFFTDQFYGYGLAAYAHDRIAHLSTRLTPGLGVGYQWFEGPTFNLSGEAGLSYLYQDYSPGGVDSQLAFRLAYHVDKALSDRVSVFNDAEWIPAVKNPANYVLNADVGIRADLTKQFFGEFKIIYRRNDNPPVNTLKDDLEYYAGIGWKF